MHLESLLNGYSLWNMDVGIQVGGGEAKGMMTALKEVMDQQKIFVCPNPERRHDPWNLLVAVKPPNGMASLSKALHFIIASQCYSENTTQYNIEISQGKCFLLISLIYKGFIFP